MRCKIVRFEKLMWRNMMKSTKSQKASVLHYSIDDEFLVNYFEKKIAKNFTIEIIVDDFTSSKDSC
jgi:hypothetical protein